MRYTCIRPIDVNIPYIAVLSQFCRCLRLRDVHILSLLHYDNFSKRKTDRKKKKEKEREREGGGRERERGNEKCSD